MADKGCFACGSPLSSPDGKMGTCANPACPGGKRFYYCGYCREIAFALTSDKMKCFNKACRTHGLVRTKCDTCEKISIIDHDGKRICVNRDCPTNREVISRCFFCGNNAFLNAPEVMFCTKGSCQQLFKRVEVCGLCRELSFVVDENTCKNASCEIAGQEVAPCPKCSLRTLGKDANGAERCLNKSCNYRPAAAKAAEEDPNSTLQSPRVDEDNTGVYAPTMQSPPRIDSAFKTMQKPPDPPPRPPVPTPVPRSGPPLSRPGGSTPTPAPRGLPPGFGPTTRPAPPPPPAPPPAPAPAPLQPATPSAALGRSLSAVEDAYQFLRSTLLTDSSGSQSPLYLIIGLSGSGKSTYLAMLGEVLRAKGSKYSFPYDGIDARWFRVDDLLAQGRGMIAEPKRVQALKVRIKDLVYEFAADQYVKYISKIHWPRATPRDEGDETVPSTFFLVTEIVRHQKPVAKVVTLETSGEEYEDVLRGFKSFAQGEEPKNAIQRVLLEMMNQAEGFIVLIDPDNADNDTIFRDFFLVLKEELQPRALNVFYQEVGAGLEQMTQGAINPSKVKDMRDLLARLSAEDEKRKRHEEAFENEKRIAGERLVQVHGKLEAGNAAILDGEDGEFLKGLEDILAQLEPALVKGAKEKVLPAGGSFSTAELRDRLITYYKGLTRVLGERLTPVMRVWMEKHKPKPAGASLWDIKRKYDLSEHFKIEMDEKSFQQRPVRGFKALNHVSVVVTKSDKYPIIYPPENYPKKKLPGCEIHLRDIEDYLKLVGGQVRYYNSSATGYTILASGSYIPGRENTHTPINVLEPLFDMLKITS